MTASTTRPKKHQFINQEIRTPVFASWFFLVVITLVSTVYYFVCQPELPIFYSLATKADYLAPKEYIFLFPAISILMNIIHLPVIKVLKEYSVLMLRLFAYTTAVLQFIFMLALLRIVVITF